MRVGDNHSIGQGEDLLEQMRSVHAEAAQAADDVSGPSGADAAGSADPAVGPQGAGKAGGPAADPLEETLLETAKGALSDQFDGPDEVRQAVVDTILEQRWGHVVDAGDDGGLGESVRDMLSGDLAFQAEVDNMLLHAARRLGASDG